MEDVQVWCVRAQTTTGTITGPAPSSSGPWEVLLAQGGQNGTEVSYSVGSFWIQICTLGVKHHSHTCHEFFLEFSGTPPPAGGILLFPLT